MHKRLCIKVFYNTSITITILYLLKILLLQIFVFPVQVEFDYRDALNLDCRLTEDERMMRDQVASYCTEKLMPRVLMANRNERKSLRC